MPNQLLAQCYFISMYHPVIVSLDLLFVHVRLVYCKAIALHSQVITEYCLWVGASTKMRGLLIKKAKGNGDMLGFLW